MKRARKQEPRKSPESSSNILICGSIVVAVKILKQAEVVLLGNVAHEVNATRFIEGELAATRHDVALAEAGNRKHTLKDIEPGVDAAVTHLRGNCHRDGPRFVKSLALAGLEGDGELGVVLVSHG